jgi:asparagine synthase (glutamine-hydrolysing)
MCGISIIINKNNQAVHPDIIRNMNDKVIHRGPDDEGYYFGDGFAFGHRRLSIIDTSAAGHQPMQKNADCIVFNGMVYNYIELRNELISEGYEFKSQTDTEVILAAYQHWKTDAFKKLNGMWAIGIYDHAEQNIILSRDHFGIKPLYYTHTAYSFAAASEIKQFTVLPGFNPVLNTSTTINFLTKGWLNYSDETFFKGVYALHPGHYLRYNLQTHQSATAEWYNLQKSIIPVTATEEEAVSEVRNLFESSVRLRMRSDVPVGSCLSGGIDSSSIVSLIHREGLANNYFSTFTSCYNNKLYDEQEYSDAVTKQTGFPSVKIFPDLQQLFTAGHFDTMLYHHDQPFSSASHYSEFNVFKAAKENNITVMLDGQGADEYVCGYPEFFTMYIRELMGKGQYGKILQLIRERGKHGKGFLKVFNDAIKSIYGYPLLGHIKNISGKLAFPWLTEEGNTMMKDTMFPVPEDIRSLSIQELGCSSLPYQLHSEDRNSMLFSIESRLPFLDHRLVEYITGLPSHYKINKGYTKYVLRQALPELPAPVRWRKDKIGFAAPDKEWVKENAALVRNELQLTIKETPFFTKHLLYRFDRFIANKLGYEPVYFRAMALRRFCRIFKMEM